MADHLDLDLDQTEKHLSDLVVKGAVWARIGEFFIFSNFIKFLKINLCPSFSSSKNQFLLQNFSDRLSGIVNFECKKLPSERLNDWSRTIDTLMDLLNKATHCIQKEEMVHALKA